MARHTESFPVAGPVAKVANACRAALPGHGWKILNDAGWAFFLKEQLDMVGLLLSYPVKFAVLLREGDDDSQSTVELKGTTFGFGPIPKGKLRKKALELRALIEAASKQG